MRRINRETGFRQAGIAYLCETEKEVAAQEAWLSEAGQYQVDARLLRGAAIDALVPGASSMFVAAMHTPTDGRAEPSQAAPAIAEAARAAGATVLTECAVRGIETQGGRVSGVVTEKGRIGCDAVLLAGGAWSRLFCGNAGIDLPQLRVLGSVFRTAPLSGGPEVTAGGSVFAFRKRLDGGYTIARRNANVADITPDSFRLLLRYLPTLSRTTARSACGSDGASSRNGASGVAGRWTRRLRSRRCACSIRRRSRPRWTRPARCCHAVSRRSRGCRWRKAGAG